MATAPMMLMLWLACAGAPDPAPLNISPCTVLAEELDDSSPRITDTLAALPLAVAPSELRLPSEQLPDRWTSLLLGVTRSADWPAFQIDTTEADCGAAVRVPVQVEIALTDGTVLSEATGTAEANEAGEAWLRAGGDIEDDAEAALAELAATTLTELRPELADATPIRGGLILLDGSDRTLRVTAIVQDTTNRQGYYIGSLLDVDFVDIAGAD